MEEGEQAQQDSSAGCACRSRRLRSAHLLLLGAADCANSPPRAACESQGEPSPAARTRAPARAAMWARVGGLVDRAIGALLALLQLAPLNGRMRARSLALSRLLALCRALARSLALSLARSLSLFFALFIPSPPLSVSTRSTSPRLVFQVTSQ
eukprot:4259315-Pleurochrysis_carterae.AAC.1